MEIVDNWKSTKKQDTLDNKKDLHAEATIEGKIVLCMQSGTYTK